MDEANRHEESVVGISLFDVIEIVGSSGLLSPQDVCRTMQTCHMIHDVLSHSEAVWHALCLRQLSMSGVSNPDALIAQAETQCESIHKAETTTTTTTTTRSIQSVAEPLGWRGTLKSLQEVIPALSFSKAETWKVDQEHYPIFKYGVWYLITGTDPKTMLAKNTTYVVTADMKYIIELWWGSNGWFRVISDGEQRIIWSNGDLAHQDMYVKPLYYALLGTDETESGLVAQKVHWAEGLKSLPFITLVSGLKSAEIKETDEASSMQIQVEEENLVVFLQGDTKNKLVLPHNGAIDKCILVPLSSSSHICKLFTDPIIPADDNNDHGDIEEDAPQDIVL